MAGIYFHIPFCKQACHYCNFYFTTSTRYLSESAHALIKELKMRKDYVKGEEIGTIYFGGGTPSMLPAHDIQSLIDAVKEEFLCSNEMEITMEANPDNLTDEYLLALKKTDVNRFSIGIQSFFEEDLKWMNRAHRADEASRCLSKVKEYGYDNISVDLIFGVPVSTKERWEENLKILSKFKPNHISCYALTVEPDTALDHHIKQGISPAVIDEAVEEQFYMAHDFLETMGYKHYEISNYAISGKESKHNSSYWKGQKYLGIGPGAHSFDGVTRGWNIAHLPKYMGMIERGESALTEEQLSEKDHFNEFVMTGIRRLEGIEIEKIHTRFPDYMGHFEKALKEVPKEYIDLEGDRLKLSRMGLLFADFVGSELFVL